MRKLVGCLVLIVLSLAMSAMTFTAQAAALNVLVGQSLQRAAFCDAAL